MENQGKLIIITGSTGSGKDTIVSRLLQINPAFKRIITATTRSPRPNEKENIDYIFLDKETFLGRKSKGDFLETVEYAGNYYGTLKSELNSLLEGKNIFWIIEATRAAKINELIDDNFGLEKAKKIKENTRVVYIDLPDQETIYKRLRIRGLSDDEIERRIRQDEKDRQECHFDHVIINSNGHLEETIQKVTEIIKA